MSNEFKRGDRVRRKHEAMGEGSTWILGRMTVTVAGCGDGMITIQEEHPGYNMWRADAFEPEPVTKGVIVRHGEDADENLKNFKAALALIGQEIGYDLRLTVHPETFEITAQAK